MQLVPARDVVRIGVVEMSTSAEFSPELSK
jgi:hypothetical protein